MTLTRQELATVLAALRYWQDELLGHVDEDTSRAEHSFPHHFCDETPLTYAEVSALCERLNTESPNRLHQAAPVLLETLKVVKAHFDAITKTRRKWTSADQRLYTQVANAIKITQWRTL